MLRCDHCGVCLESEGVSNNLIYPIWAVDLRGRPAAYCSTCWDHTIAKREERRRERQLCAKSRTRSNS